MDATLRQSEEGGEQEVRTDPAPPTTKRLSRRWQIIILTALLVAGLVFGRLLSMQGGRTGNQAEDQTASAGPAGSFRPTDRQWDGFAITQVKPAAFRPVQETDGKIAYDDDLTTQVFSPFTGRAIKVFARMGDKVDRGQPLAAIQAAEFVQGQNDLISATATLTTAKAQLSLAQSNEKRQHALFLSQGSALKDWQQSQADLSTAQGSVDSAAIALAAVRNRLRILGKTDPEITAIQNAQGSATFSPEALILAPIDGVITQRQVGLGQNIVSQSNGGSVPLFSISDLSKVWLLAYARESDTASIQAGNAVEVRVPAYPGRIFSGRISYVAPAIDVATHRLAVHAEVDNPDLALKPEMLASFRITTGSAVISPSVPEGALVYEGAKVHVWVADPTHRTITLREITVGRVDDGIVQVLAGLRDDEQVVTAGSLFIDRAVTGD